MVKTPAFFTLVVATSASLSRRPAHCDFFSSAPAAKASAIAPFDIALAAAFIAFMAFFIGAMLLLPFLTKSDLMQ